MRVTGQEAKPACGTEQLVVGVEVGINGGVYAMLLLWVHQSQDEEWGSLMRGNPSMKITGWKCFRKPVMSDPAMCNLHLTATVTGTLWWCTTRRTGQATSCIARRA